MNIIGITMGCPAGIGPEIILRYFQNHTVTDEIRPVIIGDIGVLEKYGRHLGIPANCSPWHPGLPLPAFNYIPVIEISTLLPEDVQWGKPNRATAVAMAAYIEEGVKFAQQGVINAITTCPISKLALNTAGYHFPGHTEMLAQLTNSHDFAMMMAGNRLKVTLVTIHCALRDVAGSLTVTAVERLIRMTHRAMLCDFALPAPRIAVAGLNPHSGEGTLFGTEEVDIIEPAITRCQNDGILVSGPFPADTVFYKASNGQFDAVVCMYHDQGLIPFKLLHFEDGVNVTLGLPIVRTSVDHGTAYDIAGRGLASSQSLTEAVHMAASISRARLSFQHREGSI